jgi:hypothetical protein
MSYNFLRRNRYRTWACPGIHRSGTLKNDIDLHVFVSG